MNVKFLNVIDALENMIDFSRAILEGDINAQESHVFINDTNLLIANEGWSFINSFADLL